MSASAIPIDINDAVIPFDGELVFGNVRHALLNASDSALLPQFVSDAIANVGEFRPFYRPTRSSIRTTSNTGESCLPSAADNLFIKLR
jgi:hypothetical protein